MITKDLAQDVLYNLGHIATNPIQARSGEPDAQIWFDGEFHLQDDVVKKITVLIESGIGLLVNRLEIADERLRVAANALDKFSMIHGAVGFMARQTVDEMDTVYRDCTKGTPEPVKQNVRILDL